MEKADGYDLALSQFRVALGRVKSTDPEMHGLCQGLVFLAEALQKDMAQLHMQVNEIYLAQSK